jgi:two-component system, NarL family, response regulator LiaR
MDIRNKISILVADDHPTFRDGLCRLLEDEADFKVVGSAGTAEQTVALARELKPNVAIVDVSMPGIAGIEAARQIKEACPDTAILMVSAYDYESFVLAALRAGAGGYLLKNSPSHELTGAVRKVHSGKIVLDTEIAGRALQRLSKKKAGDGDEADELHGREMEILRLVAKGCSNRDVGNQLVISERTVEAHLVRIFRKLGVGSRTRAVLCALKKGWLTIDDLP